MCAASATETEFKACYAHGIFAASREFMKPPLRSPPSRYLGTNAATARRFRGMACALALAFSFAGRLATAQQPGAGGSPPPVSRAECARAFEESQRLRNASRYLEANREVLQCTNPACGAALSEECGKIHAEIQAATPSVVFGVRDRSGRELAGASVAIDQGARTVTIDGKPVAIDPGIHSFSFSAKGFQPRAESVVILAGERYRPITVALEPAGTQLSSSEAQASMQSSQAAEPSASSPPLGSYVLGGVALLSVGAAVGLRVWGANEFDTLSRECKPDCSQSSVDSVEQKYLLSNIALAVGGAAAIAGIAVYVFASPKASLPTAALRVSQSNHGVSASITTGF
jgi:hypothetical protein